MINSCSNLHFNEFSDNIIEGIEYTANCLSKNVKRISDPLASSLPIYNILNILNKSLKLVNYYRSNVFLPCLIKSLEGVSDVAGIGSFINLSMGLVPYLAENNLDESLLKKSVDENLNLDDQKNIDLWSKRIVKQVKVSLVNLHTKREVREDVAKMLISKKMDEKVAYSLAGRITLEAKKKELLQKIYTFFFFISGLKSVCSTLQKWELIRFDKIAATIGNSRLATLLSKAAGTKITCFAVKLSISQLAIYSSLIGLSVKLVHDSYKLYQAKLEVKASVNDTTKYAKSIQERTNRIWAVTLGVLAVAVAFIPLVVCVNPVILLTVQIALATLGLINALR